MRSRASSDITAPPPALLVASPARLSQSRNRRRRASAEPRASRRADRAPPISSCVRRSYCRRTCAPPCAPPCVVWHYRASLFSPRHLASSALSEPAPATPRERRASSESSRRPSTAEVVVRASVVLSPHVRAAVCAAVRRVTSPCLIILSLSHRRLGSLRADTGDAERAPSRERVVAPTERRRSRRACAGRTADARARRRVRRRASCDITAPRYSRLVASPARLSQSRHRRRRASAEPRASRRADRAPPISSCVRRSYCRRTCAPPCAPPCVV